jgi:hypothetical protein
MVNASLSMAISAGLSLPPWQEKDSCKVSQGVFQISDKNQFFPSSPSWHG